MSFIDARMPDDISYGLQSTAGYKTDVIVLASGHEQRNILWDDARRRYDLAYVRTQTQADTLAQFFHSMKGRAHSFRLKDPTDYSATTSNGLLGTGVGTGRLRPDPVAAAVKAEDRTAAGGDGVDMHHRRPHPHPAGHQRAQRGAGPGDLHPGAVPHARRGRYRRLPAVPGGGRA